MNTSSGLGPRPLKGVGKFPSVLVSRNSAVVEKVSFACVVESFL